MYFNGAIADVPGRTLRREISEELHDIQVQMSPADQARLDRMCESPICHKKGHLARKARVAMKRPTCDVLVEIRNKKGRQEAS